MSSSVTGPAPDPTPPVHPVHPGGTPNQLVDLPHHPTAMTWHAALTAAPCPARPSRRRRRTVLVRSPPPLIPRPPAASCPISSRRTPDHRAARRHRRGALQGRPQSSPPPWRVADALVDWRTSTTWAAAFAGSPPASPTASADPPTPSTPRHDSPRAACRTGRWLAEDFSAVCADLARRLATAFCEPSGTPTPSTRPCSPPATGCTTSRSANGSRLARRTQRCRRTMRPAARPAVRPTPRDTQPPSRRTTRCCASTTPACRCSSKMPDAPVPATWASTSGAAPCLRPGGE